MNPQVIAAIWSVLMLALLIWIIRRLYKYVRSLLPLLFIVAAIGCKKEKFTTPTIPASFKNMDQAKKYLEPFMNVDTAWSSGGLNDFAKITNQPNESPLCFNYYWTEWDENGRVISSEFLFTACGNNGGGQLQNEKFNSGNCDYGNPTVKKWTLWAGHAISFAYKKNMDASYAVTEISTSLIGLTPGVSWKHNQGSGTSIVDENGNLIITATGTQTYSILVEGIGTILTQEVKITVKYNPCKGTSSIQIKNA